MTRTALALSPHLDDAVFSCGGTMAMLARAGWRVVVATLFTQSVADPQGFALACQLDKGLAADCDYMAMRRAEDRDAARALGLAEPIHVPLPEAPHRGYDSAAALFGPLSRRDAIAGPLRRAVRRLITDHDPDLVLAPQAIGGHVDHVQVVEALAGTPRATLWWRDFPYVSRTAAPAQPFADRMRALPEHLVQIDAGAADAKYLACLAYGTQLGFQFGGRDGLRARLSEAGGVEGFRGLLPDDLRRDMGRLQDPSGPQRSSSSGTG